MQRTRIWPLAVVSLALVLAVAAAAGVAGAGREQLGPGPGMTGSAFGGFGGGGAGPTGTRKPTAAQLAGVRVRIDRWLARNGFQGFRVAEVMAFTNNDYVAVHTPKGAPAFELLTDLRTTWLMGEPSSMMWNTRYGVAGRFGGFGPMMGGMMGGWMHGGWDGWYARGAGRVTTVKQAVAVANRWLARAGTPERVAADAGPDAKFPGYYTLDTERAGKTVGMLSVNASTGAVWYHGWHGRFLAEQEF